MGPGWRCRVFTLLIQPLVFMEDPEDPGPRPYAWVISEGLSNIPMVAATLVQRPNYLNCSSYGWCAYPFTW